MAKVERIIKLLDLISRSSNLTIEEMSKACEVSQRTIYRYLNTLSSLDIRSHLDGRVWGNHSEGKVLGLDQDDFELILFCLGHNSLIRYPFFAQKFEKIKKELYQFSEAGADGAITILKADVSTQKPISDEQSGYLELFVEAIRTGRNVQIKTWNESLARNYEPDSIRLGRNGPVLIVELKGSGIRQDLYLSEVASLNLE